MATRRQVQALVVSRQLRHSPSTFRKTMFSSWTKVNIPSTTVPVVGEGGMITTLQFQQQFTTPPGATTNDSTGRRLWPTSIPLLEWILLRRREERRSTIFSDKKPLVLELGAGCGLVGMGLAVAAGAEFERIILTDASTDWLQRHVDRNGANFQCPVDVFQLQWGKKYDQDNIRAHLEHICSSPSVPVPATSPPPTQSRTTTNSSITSTTKNATVIDYILGSDLLYNPSSQKDLITTLTAMASSQTRILLAYPKRGDNETSFQALAEQNGFHVQIESLQVPNQHESQVYSLMILVKQR